MSIQIHDRRKEVLADEWSKPYFQNIETSLAEKKAAGEVIYPPSSLIFHAFDLTPFDELKVVILGQDPYHGPGQAHGLCFSVPDGVKIPPSLKNIYKEIIDDCGGDKPPISSSLRSEEMTPLSGGTSVGLQRSGNLEYLAKQGVFLLNAILTVAAKQPASHKDIGRGRFTDSVIKKVSDEKKGVIFLLRGNFAKQKRVLIDTEKHTVLEAPHPSPFSVHKGFFGCKHFSQTNQLLAIQGKEEIQWSP